MRHVSPTLGWQAGPAADSPGTWPHLRQGCGGAASRPGHILCCSCSCSRMVLGRGEAPTVATHLGLPSPPNGAPAAAKEFAGSYARMVLTPPAFQIRHSALGAPRVPGLGHHPAPHGGALLSTSLLSAYLGAHPGPRAPIRPSLCTWLPPFQLTAGTGARGMWGSKALGLQRTLHSTLCSCLGLGPPRGPAARCLGPAVSSILAGNQNVGAGHQTVVMMSPGGCRGSLRGGVGGWREAAWLGLGVPPERRWQKQMEMWKSTGASGVRTLQGPLCPSLFLKPPPESCPGQILAHPGGLHLARVWAAA